jgi:hypothetical protein
MGVPEEQWTESFLHIYNLAEEQMEKAANETFAKMTIVLNHSILILNKK